MKWINNYNLFESLEDSGENGIDVNYLRDCFIELIDRDITTVNSKSNFMNRYPMWQISITYKTERNNNIWTDHDGDISLLDDLLKLNNESQEILNEIKESIRLVKAEKDYHVDISSLKGKIGDDDVSTILVEIINIIK
jgi:hypothetical protein